MRKGTFKTLLATLVIATFSLSATATEKVEQIISSVKKEVAPDTRTTIWEIKPEKNGSEYIITGKVDKAQSKTALINALDKSGIKYTEKVTILPTREKQWGVVNSAIASLRGDGKHSAELVTQALTGTPVRILEEKGSWLRIQTPDNYISYSPASSITEMTEAELNEWKKSKRYIVTVNNTIITEKDDSNSPVVSQVFLGAILKESAKPNKEYVKVEFVDGRKGYIKTSDIQEFQEWANQSYNPELIEKTARSMIGVPYLWGGFSTFANDCSGFAKLCYAANGIILQRDASQQALTGKIIKAEDWKSAIFGDLFFFGGTRVTHVAIHLNNGDYIHSNGSGKLSINNSVNPESDIYTESNILTISRINGSQETKGITTFKQHPWYF